MALTLYEASKLSRNPLASGILKAVATSDELMAVMPARATMGEAISYKRVKALPTVGFVAPGGTVSESSGTFDQVTTALRIINSDVDTLLFSEEQQGDVENQRAIQVNLKAKALGRKLGEKLVTGKYATSVAFSASIAGVASPVAGPNQDTDRHGPGSLFFDQSASTLQYRGPGDRDYGEAVDVSSNGTYTLSSDNPNKRLTVTVTSASLPGADAEVLVRISSTSNEFDGLEDLCPEAQTVESGGTNGDALSFDVLDELIDEKLKVRENAYFVMNGKLKRKFLALLRATGGATPADMAVAGINRPVPTYRGIPILQNDHIPSNEAKGSASDLSSVYLASMEAEEGLSWRVGGRGEGVLADLDPRAVRIMGTKLRMIGELEDSEHHRMRLSWYGCVRLGSELAIARASELITA